MDFYAVLKVPPKATQVELDRAYQKLVKDARYDNTINRKDLETAYRTLSDATQRALYDATVAQKNKSAQPTRRLKLNISSLAERKKRMMWVMMALFMVACVYYPIRFGYQLKEFSKGDALYFKDSDDYFGVVLTVDPGHNFGNQSTAGYLVKTESDTDVWFPAGDVKTLCYKKK